MELLSGYSRNFGNSVVDTIFDRKRNYNCYQHTGVFDDSYIISKIFSAAKAEIRFFLFDLNILNNDGFKQTLESILLDSSKNIFIVLNRPSTNDTEKNQNSMDWLHDFIKTHETKSTLKIGYLPQNVEIKKYPKSFCIADKYIGRVDYENDSKQDPNKTNEPQVNKSKFNFFKAISTEDQKPQFSILFGDSSLNNLSSSFDEIFVSSQQDKEVN